MKKVLSFLGATAVAGSLMMGVSAGTASAQGNFFVTGPYMDINTCNIVGMKETAARGMPFLGCDFRGNGWYVIT